MARGLSKLVAGAVLASGWLVSALAAAQPLPSLDLRRWSASTDPNASLYLEPAATPGHLEWNIGAWASYAHRLVTLKDARGDEAAVPVRHQLSTDWVFGLGLTDRLALGVVLPTVLYQTGDDLERLFPDTEKLKKTAFGDLAFTAKATLIPTGELGGFALAALARVSVPTGDSTSYISESTAGGEFRVLGELGLVALTVRATGGVRVRGAEQTYARVTFGHELPWAAGFTFKPRVLGIDDAGHWEWNLETHGAVSLTPTFAATRQSPSSIGLSARYAVGPVAFVAGGELPFTDAVGSPSTRAVFAVSFAPRFPDTDGDGIEDSEDQCAELAEDKDGFEDGDGCPDFDNDGDGVPDETDKCPLVPEDTDEYQDEDGCPDPDNDADGVPDAQDQCPKEPGPANVAGAAPGCPLKDQDVDGIPDPVDQCPKQAEDRDSFEDTDGCPDPDNDGDGVPDAEDTCPEQKGPARSDPALNGCPSPDRDGDTFDDAEDKCPEQPEDFNGNADDDGCPDDPAKAPLSRFVEEKNGLRLVLSRPIAFDNEASLDPKSEASVRAIAALLNQNPEVVLLIGVRPKGAGGDAEQQALNRSFAIVEALRRYTHRDEVAETIGWTAVRKVVGAAAQGIGFLALSPHHAAAAEPGAPKP